MKTRFKSGKGSDKNITLKGNKNKQHNSINSQEYLRQFLISRYVNSHSYTYIKLIDRIVQKKCKYRGDHYVENIYLQHSDQCMNQYFHTLQINVEIRELLEYYKYYLMEPQSYPKAQFQLMDKFREKRKFFLYKKIKYQINLKSKTSLETQNSKSKLGNVLNQIKFSKILSHDDFYDKRGQSFYFLEMIKSMNRQAKHSRFSSIDKVDIHFSALLSPQRNKSQCKHRKSIESQRSKRKTKVCQKIKVKKKKIPSTRGKHHASCDRSLIPKSFLKSFVKRQNSATQLIHSPQKNPKKRKNIKSSRKNEMEKATPKREFVATQFELKESIEETKKKIKREKEIISCNLTPTFLRSRNKN